MSVALLPLWQLLVEVRRRGVVMFVLNTLLLGTAQVLLVAAAFGSVVTGGHGWDLVFESFPYVVSVVALSNGFGFWEGDLVFGTWEQLRLHASPAYLAGCAAAATLLTVPCCALVLLAGAVAGRLTGPSALLVAAFAVAGSVLGCFLGFWRAFTHEKAINNFLYVVLWVVALAPGPVMGTTVHRWQLLFPSAAYYRGDLPGTLLRLALWVVLGVGAAWLGRRPLASHGYQR